MNYSIDTRAPPGIVRDPPVSRRRPEHARSRHATAAGSGSACDQHHLDAGGRRSADGEFRPSGHAYERGPGCVHAVATPAALRSIGSSGHASTLLYRLIHLAGIKAMNPSCEQVGRDAVTLDDIKGFRQAGSRCPGHPEYGWTSGVETTTGPLGQGAATSVGMAIARRWLSATVPASICSTSMSICCVAMAT